MTRAAVPYGRDNAAILGNLCAAGWPADRLWSYLKAAENLENLAGDSEGRNSQSGERRPMSVSVRLGTVWRRRSGAEQGCSRHVGAWRVLACLRACLRACECVFMCVFVCVCSHDLKTGSVFICNNATFMNSVNAIRCNVICHFLCWWSKNSASTN